MQDSRNSMRSRGSSSRSPVAASRKGGEARLNSLQKENLAVPLREERATRHRRSHRRGSMGGVSEKTEADEILPSSSRKSLSAVTHDFEHIANPRMQSRRNSMRSRGSSSRSPPPPSRKGGEAYMSSSQNEELAELLRDESATRHRRSHRRGSMGGVSEKTEADEILPSSSRKSHSRGSSSGNRTIRRSTRGDFEPTEEGGVHAAKPTYKKSSSFSGPNRCDSSSNRVMRRAASGEEPDKTERSSSALRSRRQARGLESGGLTRSNSHAKIDRDGNESEVPMSSGSSGGYEGEGPAGTQRALVDGLTNKSQPLRRTDSGAKLALEVAAHRTPARRASASEERRGRRSKMPEYEENASDTSSRGDTSKSSHEQRHHSAKALASKYSIEVQDLWRKEECEPMQKHSELSRPTRSRGRRNDPLSSRSDHDSISTSQRSSHHSPPPPDSPSQDISPTNLRGVRSTRLRRPDSFGNEPKYRATRRSSIGHVATPSNGDEWVSPSPAPRLAIATGRRAMMQKAFSISALDPNHHRNQTGRKMASPYTGNAAVLYLLNGDISTKTDDTAPEENDSVVELGKPATSLSAKAQKAVEELQAMMGS